MAEGPYLRVWRVRSFRFADAETFATRLLARIDHVLSGGGADVTPQPPAAKADPKASAATADPATASDEPFYKHLLWSSDPAPQPADADDQVVVDTAQRQRARVELGQR